MIPILSHFRSSGAFEVAKSLRFVGKLWRGEEGATVVEYVLLIMLVALACFAAVAALGVSLSGPFQHAVNGLS